MTPNSGLRARVLALLAAVLLALGSSAAPAQTRDTTSERLDAIRTRMEKGQATFVAGKYGEAAEIFESGFKSYPYSAFLFNAGVCYQKLGDTARAITAFREYLKVDPTAPDKWKVEQRILSLEAASGATPSGGAAGTGGAPPVAPIDDSTAMKSLVVIETEPPGAPLKVYARVRDGAAPFAVGAANDGWAQVSDGTAPTNLTLEVGQYHVVVEKFQDFNVSQADINVSPGHVHHFKANLSQGEFMAFMRVSANVPGAYVYVDDPTKARPFWGRTPHGELVSSGSHEVLVEAPGFAPSVQKIQVTHGEQKEIAATLDRVNYGILRFSSAAPAITVAVDGQPKGNSQSGGPALDVQLPSGPHQISVVADGRKTYEGKLEVPRGQVQPVSVRMIPKYPRGAAWTEAVIGAAFVGAGVFLGLESNKVHDELQADRDAGILDEGDSRVGKGRWFAIGADIGFVLGGALGVLATYDFIKDPLPESSVELGKLQEFADPNQALPASTTPAAPRAPPAVKSSSRERGSGPERQAQAPALELGADSNGLFLGGRF